MSAPACPLGTPWCDLGDTDVDGTHTCRTETTLRSGWTLTTEREPGQTRPTFALSDPDFFLASIPAGRLSSAAFQELITAGARAIQDTQLTAARSPAATP